MLNIVIVDDELPAIYMLKDLLLSYNQINIIGEFTDFEDVLASVDLQSIDVIFLDIEMATIDGLEAASILRQTCSDIDIVFVTSYKEYSLQAFDVFAFGYILKPIFKDKLDQTVQLLFKKHHISETRTFKALFMGQFELFNQQGELIKWRTTKTKELAAYFFHDSQNNISKERIIYDLWPETSYSKAIDLFHTTLSYLRSALKDATKDTAISHNNGSYFLEVEHVDCDFRIIENLYDTRSFKSYDKAIKLYKGAFLEYDNYHWSLSTQQELQSKYEEMLNYLLDHYMNKKNYIKSISYLELYLDSNPYDQTAQVKLLDLYAMSKNIQAVKKYYQALIHLYGHELEINMPDDIHQKYLNILENI